MKGAFHIFCRYNFLMRESFWEIAEITAETIFFQLRPEIENWQEIERKYEWITKIMCLVKMPQREIPLRHTLWSV